MIETGLQPEDKCPPADGADTSGQQQRGVAAFFGTWPGEETDEGLARMLKELREERGRYIFRREDELSWIQT